MLKVVKRSKKDDGKKSECYLATAERGAHEAYEAAVKHMNKSARRCLVEGVIGCFETCQGMDGNTFSDAMSATAD